MRHLQINWLHKSQKSCQIILTSGIQRIEIWIGEWNERWLGSQGGTFSFFCLTFYFYTISGLQKHFKTSAIQPDSLMLTLNCCWLEIFVFVWDYIFSAAKLLSHFSRVRLCVIPYGSPPGSPIPGILQARTLEWVAISFSNASKWKVKVKSLSRVQPSGTPWTAAYQAPPSMGFSRQEYWSGVPLPSPIYPLVSYY